MYVVELVLLKPFYFYVSTNLLIFLTLL